MTYAQSILPEFDQEMANTRKVLERIADDKLDWQAHRKSHTIGWNANHLADMVHWLTVILTSPSLDLAPVGGQPYKVPALTSRSDILRHFDGNVTAARSALGAARDEQLSEIWTLLSAGKPIMAMPRAAMIRSFVLNHIIHHRAILCVYLRLNDIPVPGMYGPSGDE
jgi:uncharacterized damage-inducible protein DinB